MRNYSPKFTLQKLNAKKNHFNLNSYSDCINFVVIHFFLFYFHFNLTIKHMEIIDSFSRGFGFDASNSKKTWKMKCTQMMIKSTLNLRQSEWIYEEKEKTMNFIR